MAPIGVLYDVLATTNTAATTAATTAAAAAGCGDPQTPPEWVLDERDGGSLVWRRYGGPAGSLGRRRVEFLDAVQVHVFERDDYGDQSDGCSDDNDGDDSGVGGQPQQCWADDWCWDEWDDGGGGGGGAKKLFYRQPGSGGLDDYPVLAAVSVTVLGLCFGLAYLFAPVRWLLHQLTVDD